jgi:hypothetical protein
MSEADAEKVGGAGDAVVHPFGEGKNGTLGGSARGPPDLVEIGFAGHDSQSLIV